MKTSELLIAAKALIANPKNWTQGVLARGPFKEEIEWYSANACSFCSVGAVYRTNIKLKTAMSDWDDAFHYLNKQSANLFHLPTITRANDALDHSQVMAIWDAAIAEAVTREENRRKYLEQL